MTTDTTLENKANPETVEKKDAAPAKDAKETKQDAPRWRRKPGWRNDRGSRRPRKEKVKKEFQDKLLALDRVTNVKRGGRSMSFRATILIGNEKGRIGIGVAKGKDVAIAVKKATHEAYKNIVTVPITENGSIPYQVMTKNKASRIKLIPAASGTGLKAGSTVRMVLELAWYSNMLSKIIGTNNKLNNALSTVKALTRFKTPRKAAKTTKKAPKKDK